MNEDYLMPPFSDEFKRSLKAAMDAIQKSTNMTKSLQPMLANFEMIRDLQSTYISKNLKNSLKILSDLPVYRPNENLMRIIKDITITLNEKGYFETEEFIESVIKEDKIYSDETENQETSEMVVTNDNDNSWEQYQKNKYVLDFAFFQYHDALEKFNEVFHKGYSYVSEKKIVVFGLSNAIVYLITTLASVNSMLPFYLFSVISFAGFFTPKDK